MRASSDWDAENDRLLQGGPPQTCPRCGRTAFYGPRRASPEKKYRACTFCGFWQEQGGEEQTGIAWAHGCTSWPLVAGARLVEWSPPGTEKARCPVCGDEVAIEGHAVTAPAEDPEHAWWRVPQNMSAVESLLYWRAHLESRLPLHSRLYL